MRTIRTKVYKFDELTPEAQNKAVELLSDINTDHQWWDFVYDDFIRLAEYFGIEIEKKNGRTQMLFNGFYSQGSGSAFAGSIDVQKFVSAIENETWKEYAPHEDFSFYPVTANIKRVCKLIQSGAIDWHAGVEITNRGKSVKLDYDWSFASDYKCNTVRIETAINDLIELLQDAVNNLNDKFYSFLERGYEYLSSREAIVETIKSNDYYFFRDGKLYDGR